MRPPIASSRDASSTPHRSTAALSVVGDSIATSASAVSSTHCRSARQKSLRSIIVAMMEARSRAFLCVLGALWLFGGGVQAQQLTPPAPQPFPRPGTARPAPPPTTPPATPAPGTATRPAPGQPEAPPSETMLGVPIFPGAQFIASYDAGRG